MANVLKILFMGIIMCVCAQTVYAQDDEPISEAQAMQQESMQALMQTEESNENYYNDNLSPQQRFEENPKANVHQYDYKQQVIVGGVVMFCVAIAMIANNNYNPKKPTQ